MKQALPSGLTRSLLPLALALAALLCGQGRSDASLEKMRGEMSKFAGELKQWLNDRGEPGIVTLSSFQGLPELKTNPGPGLAYILTQELRKASVPVRNTAPLRLAGKLYRFPETGDVNKVKYLTITMEIVGGNRVVHHEELRVRDKESLDLILGRDNGPDKVKIKGNRFFKGPYGVEILVNGRPRKAKMVNGMPYVTLEPEDEYTIRLVNESEQEAAVWVGIDGLSMFAFSQDEERDGRWRDYRVLIDGRKDGEEEALLAVEGWYFHNRENGSRKFRVTEYPQTAAALKKLSLEKLGMITLQFWESKPKGTDAKAVGTGFGKAFTQEWTPVERSLGPLKATITIRYDRDR